MVQRRNLLAAVQEAFASDAAWEGHIVCGFAIVVELAGPDGGRGLASRSSDASGETDLTPWAAEGLLANALRSDMFEADDSDAGDED